MPSQTDRLAFCVALLVCLLALAGCRESVDPIVGSEVPFTIWGFVNAGADTQYVRVFEVSDQLVPDLDATIDARVVSTDLTSGSSREWTYERVVFDSSIAGHVFWAPFRAETGHRYRLEVIRSDGETSSVEVTVPEPVELTINTSEIQFYIPVHIQGDIPNLVGPRVIYTGINVPPSNAWPPGTPVHPPVLHSVTIDYTERMRRVGGEWLLPVNFAQDRKAVYDDFAANCLITGAEGSAPNVWIRGLEISVLAADSTWSPPGGVFDPDRLSVPGTFSNVENGYGFFGAGIGFTYRLIPPPEALMAAGYSFQGKCPGMATPECANPPIPCLGENDQDVWRNWLR